MKRFLFIALLILASSVLFAQDMVVTQTPLIRHFPLNYSGVAPTAGGNAPTFEWDFSQDPSGATVTTNSSHVMTKVGSSDRVNSGTWSSGLSGSQDVASYTFDGSTDYWTLADGAGFDEPAGDFSVQLCFTPDNPTANTEDIIAKFDSGSNERSWMIVSLASNALSFQLSDDGTNAGGHLSQLDTGNTIYPGRMTFVTVAYDYTSDGSSNAYIYVNNDATASSAAFDGPAYGSGSADFVIGARHGGTAPYLGKLHYVAVYPGVVLTEANHDEDYKKWSGLLGTTLNQVTVTSATPPSVQLTALDSGTQPMFVGVGANSFMVGSSASGSGGIYGAGAITSLAQRGSFETFAAGVFTGWTETAGGAGDCTQDTTNMVHGLSSATLDCSGAGDTISITSACLDIDPSKDYVLSLYAKELTGNSDLNITVKGWSDATCESDEVTELTNTPGDITTSWVRYPTGTSGQILTAAWEGTTEYATIIIDNSDDNGTGTLSVDGVMFQENQTIVPNALAVCDTDATCSTSDVRYTINTPLSGASTYRIQSDWIFPFDVENATAQYLFWATQTGGTNNNKIAIVIDTNNDIVSAIYNSSGTYKNSTIDTLDFTWAADTEKTLEFWKGHDGELDICLDAVCESSDTGPSVQDDTNATFYINSWPNTASHSWGWVKDLKFFRRLSP